MHEDWVPDPGIFPWAQMHVDVRLPAAITDRIVGVFRDWWIANKPRTARDAKGWRAALMGWLKRERENKPHLEQSFHLDDSDVVLWRKTPKGFDWHDGQGLAPREDYEEAS